MLQNRLFFRFVVEIHPVLELQVPTPLRVVLLCFATQSSARSSLVLCVILLSFACLVVKASEYVNACHV